MAWWRLKLPGIPFDVILAASSLLLDVLLTTSGFQRRQKLGGPAGTIKAHFGRAFGSGRISVAGIALKSRSRTFLKKEKRMPLFLKKNHLPPKNSSASQRQR
jgi:hypothetical protein